MKDIIKLWSIQREEIYDDLIKNDVFSVDDKYVWKEYPKAYQFIVEEMKKRVTGYDSKIHFPIWSWYLYDGKNKKPDFRVSGLANRGEKSICIELELPREEVLLSDFDKWHIVLMDCEDYDKTDIFNLDYDRNEIITNYYVQATFWKIKREYIKNIKHFIAK